MLDNNLIVKKNYNFTLMMYKFLSKNNAISKQLLRSSTSIGTNIQEAQAGISKKDFIAKMSIAAKEALETRYWLNLLIESNDISKNKEKIQDLLNEIEFIIKILTKIIKSSQKEKNEK
jgi:four helix bundle protein